MQCIQVGGPDVPWKCVALPPSDSDKILVRPSPRRGGHPLEVVVSSGNLALDGLMALLQRGELQQAISVEKNQARLAERFLFRKHSDPAAAAVGGYYLLRINDLDKLHDWANNLANRFGWLPDGAIIHAWQLITEYRSDRTRFSRNLEIARERLLEAIDRGFPIYTEGLRLLRDGLLLFEQQSGGEYEMVNTALERAGEYVAAADWTVPLTTFIGKTPDRPSPSPETGMPDSREGLEYIYNKKT
jgi:hypothetical protein